MSTSEVVERDLDAEEEITVVEGKPGCTIDPVDGPGFASNHDDSLAFGPIFVLLSGA